jgi:hypothetical protein
MRDTYTFVYVDQPVDTRLELHDRAAKVSVDGVSFHLFDAASAEHIGRVFLGAAEAMRRQEVPA